MTLTTLIRRLRFDHYVAAIFKLWRSGKGLLPKDKIKERLEICNNCEYFKGTYCERCGCCTGAKQNHFNKLAYPTEECPDGRW